MRKWINVSSKEDFRKQTGEIDRAIENRLDQRSSLAQSLEVVLDYDILDRFLLPWTTYMQYLIDKTTI